MSPYKDLSSLRFEDADVRAILDELHELQVLLSVIETKIAQYHTRRMR